MHVFVYALSMLTNTTLNAYLAALEFCLKKRKEKKKEEEETAHPINFKPLQKCYCKDAKFKAIATL